MYVNSLRLVCCLLLTVILGYGPEQSTFTLRGPALP